MVVHGKCLSGLVTLEVETKKDRAWLRANVHAEPWQWKGRELMVEARSARPIVAAIRNAGLLTEGEAT
jgi:hypothetical protein